MSWLQYDTASRRKLGSTWSRTQNCTGPSFSSLMSDVASSATL
jgi:hypothetical protein